MNLLKFTRYVEWWEYKLPPLLSVAYATVIYYNYPLQSAIMQILLLLAAVIVGAVYVSVVNDVTDIKSDLAAGKSNSMAKVPSPVRGVLLAAILAGSLFFSWLLYPDLKSIFFYNMAYLVFSLYSIRPFRFKERGLLGVACDAMGAHLFPALLITANLIYFMEVQGQLLWYLAIAFWSFIYGVRGILWHQFHDRDNDLKSGTKTFATATDPAGFKAVELALFIIELVAFLTFISFVMDGIILLSVFIYVGLAALRLLIFKRKLRIILTTGSEGYQLVLNEFYIVFLPIALLIQICLTEPFAWLILCAHILIFPMNIFSAVRDCFLSLKYIVFRLV